MIRKIKMIALAAFALAALGAVSASAASAAEFTSGSGYPVTVSGEQDDKHTFVYQGREVTCETAQFTSAPQGGPSNTITITPTYADCHTVVLGITFPATVTFNGCDYEFEAAAPTDAATVDLVCPTGQNVQIHVYEGTSHSSTNELCTYTVHPQNGLGTIEYHNNAAGTVTVTANVGGIVTTRTSGTALLCGSASGTSTYSGDTTVEGDEGSKSIHVG